MKHFKFTKWGIPDLLDTKTFIIMCIFGFLLGWFIVGPLSWDFAHAAWPECNPKDNNIKILSGVTIVASGTSTYIVDLRDHCIVSGDFSIQFSGLTCAAGAYNAGADINAYYRVSNHIPSGLSIYRGLLPHDSEITDNFEQVTIVSALAFDSGNSQYIYDFFPDVCRFLIIDITAGVVSMNTDVWLEMY